MTRWTSPPRHVTRLTQAEWDDLRRAATADDQARHREARRAKARAFADAKRARLEAVQGS